MGRPNSSSTSLNGKLSSKEQTLLLEIFTAVGGCKNGDRASLSAWSMLKTIAAKLGYEVCKDGSLRNSKKNESHDIPATHSDGEMKGQAQHLENSWSEAKLLVPRVALTPEGEKDYLENFAVHEVDTDDSSDSSPCPGPLVKGLSSRVPDNVMQTLLWPVTTKEFTSAIYQKSALFVSRGESYRTFYKEIFSSQDLWKLLQTNEVEYGANVDVTKYTLEKQRQTFNSNEWEAEVDEGPAGLCASSSGKKKKRKRAKHAHNSNPLNGDSGGAQEENAAADLAVVRRRFRAGCSVRLLHPQRWSESVATLLSCIEQVMHCPVGCNVYLTPSGSQGFAPHFDDVDVYILQVEGAKRWRVYPPLQGHALPRYSSRDFTDDEIGEPLLDTVLQPGDLLYLPRGTIHQAESCKDCHSMHLTVSTDHQRSWADFLELALQVIVLHPACKQVVNLRRDAKKKGCSTQKSVENKILSTLKKTGTVSRIDRISRHVWFQLDIFNDFEN